MEPYQLESLIVTVVESGIYILLFFSAVALVVGTVLLISPQKFERLRRVSDYWISSRRALRPLDIPRDSDPFLYRHHQWVGGIAIVLPIITLYLLLYYVEDQLPHSAVSINEQYYFWGWLFDSSLLFLWITNILAFIVGIFIFFRPSMLKVTERIANRWLSTRKWFNKVDSRYSKFDELMFRQARWTGLFLVLGSLYVLLVIVMFMLQHPDWLAIIVAHMYKG